MIKKEKKITIKAFIIIYIISFIIINWNDISWLFNYKAVFGLADDFFTPYPSIKAVASVNETLYLNNQNINPQNNSELQNIKPVYTSKENSIEIPSIGIIAPIIFSKTTDKNLIAKDLDNGVVYYPGSVLPGQNGQIIILGHSAPLNWPKIKHDWVFSKINNLETGDEIIVNLENKQYLYIVKEKTIIERGEEINSNMSPEDFNSLILVSCWPPGKDILRIAVKSYLYIEKH
jgi:LPXTG-site transpeptidase (sortase) family protein